MIPEVGIHTGVGATTYHSWRAANFSFLKHFRHSAAHAREEQLHPKEPTAAMALGSALHAAMLEPKAFHDLYCCGIRVDRRTKAGKAEWAAFEAENAGKEILKPEDWGTCEAMADAIWSHPLASEILSGPGMQEVCAVWDDPETGIRCKSRMDRVSAWADFTWIWDLKKTQDASPRGFRRAVAMYDMHCQGAHYLDGLSVLEPRQRRFGLIAIEEKPPHCIGVYELEECDIEQGRYEVSQWLAALKHAQDTDTWPGYPLEIQAMALPVWRRKEYEYGE